MCVCVCQAWTAPRERGSFLAFQVNLSVSLVPLSLSFPNSPQLWIHLYLPSPSLYPPLSQDSCSEWLVGDADALMDMNKDSILSAIQSSRLYWQTSVLQKAPLQRQPFRVSGPGIQRQKQFGLIITITSPHLKRQSAMHI